MTTDFFFFVIEKEKDKNKNKNLLPLLFIYLKKVSKGKRLNGRK